MGHQYCDFSSCDKWLCYLCAKYCRYCGREFCHDHLCPPIHGCDGCVDPFPYQRTTDDELRSQIAEDVQVPEGGGEVGTHSPTNQLPRGNSSDSDGFWLCDDDKECAAEVGSVEFIRAHLIRQTQKLQAVAKVVAEARKLNPTLRTKKHFPWTTPHRLRDVDEVRRVLSFDQAAGSFK